MDAPPEKEPVDSFLQMGFLFHEQGLRVPHIMAEEKQQGFLLLSDFGNTLLLHALNAHTADELYERAMDQLRQLQKIPLTLAGSLPAFTPQLLSNELALFKEWFLEKFLELSLSSEEQQLLQTLFDELLEMAQSQPQVLVHRDYHSRNLMVMDEGPLGILDFQDAVVGPITYDAVSLLKDCYIQWPIEKIKQWSRYFYQLLYEEGSYSFSWLQWCLWFDFMGLQRHLKASFIFARKWLRDGDPRYLKHIAPTLQYVEQVGAHYPALQGFHQILKEKILPAAAFTLKHATECES